jgi:hypothetical protein
MFPPMISLYRCADGGTRTDIALLLSSISLQWHRHNKVNQIAGLLLKASVGFRGWLSNPDRRRQEQFLLLFLLVSPGARRCNLSPSALLAPSHILLQRHCLDGASASRAHLVLRHLTRPVHRIGVPPSAGPGQPSQGSEVWRSWGLASSMAAGSHSAVAVGSRSEVAAVSPWDSLSVPALVA